MKEQDEKSGIARIAHGDEQAARQLRANLAVFARRVGTPQIRKLVSEVLAGQRDVREVFATREYRQAVTRNIARIEAGIAALTDEERARVFDPDRPRTAAAKLDSMRDRAVAGRPPLDSEQVVDPDAGNEDRETFMVRRRRA